MMVLERISAPLGLDRRGRGMTRHLTYEAHTRDVLVSRLALLLAVGELRQDRYGAMRVHAPAWKPGKGLRTVMP
jgi:hypothetical protein